MKADLSKLPVEQIAQMQDHVLLEAIEGRRTFHAPRGFDREALAHIRLLEGDVRYLIARLRKHEEW